MTRGTSQCANCKSKFICTIGPASSSEARLRELILNGMSTVRLNFSHCSHEFAKGIILKVREISKDIRNTVGILVDLNGPKLRTGGLPDGKGLELQKGDRFYFYERDPVQFIKLTSLLLEERVDIYDGNLMNSIIYSKGLMNTTTENQGKS